MKRSIVVILFCFALVAAFGQTKVALIPTIHGLHKSNPLYNYDSVRAIISRMKPDVIAVEIRSTDVKADTGYLRKNYPYEMWMMRYWFPQSATEGFDWLGEDLEGKPVPENYWQQQSQIKKLERQLDEDSVYGKRFSTCDQYVNGRLAILKTESLTGILKSNDAELIRNYYSCMKQQLKGSIYEALPDFYEERNRQMELRLRALVEKYPNKKMVVLTGDDHYPYLLEYLKTLNVKLLTP